MKITYGVYGLENSWQDVFPIETKCQQLDCDGMCRPAINITEESGEKEYISHLYNNDGGYGGDFWLHDAASFQIYLCRKCLNPVALYNQG